MAGTDILHADSVTPKVLYSAQLGTSVDAAIYTVAAAQSVKISTAVVCNTSGAAATVFLGLGKVGDSIGASHRVISGYSLAAGDSLDLSAYLGEAFLGTGDFISAHSGTATAINLIITGTVHA